MPLLFRLDEDTKADGMDTEGASASAEAGSEGGADAADEPEKNPRFRDDDQEMDED
jgi:hypothetical protein